MGTFFGLIAVLFAVLQIILFFKLWGMTNDIRAIKEKYLSSEEPSCVKTTSSSIEGFNVGDLVVEIATDKQMRIKSITKDGNNILQVMENLGNAVINYTEEQKGWKMRCRILSNGKEENIEVQFNVNLEQITDILPYQYAITYEKLRHMNNSNDFWILKKQFDKRNN